MSKGKPVKMFAAPATPPLNAFTVPSEKPGPILASATHRRQSAKPGWALGSISRSDRQWRQPGTRPSLSKFCRWTKRQRKVSVRSHQTGEQGSMVRSQSRKLTAVLKRGCWVEGIQPAVEIVNQKWNVLPGGRCAQRAELQMFAEWV